MSAQRPSAGPRASGWPHGPRWAAGGAAAELFPQHTSGLGRTHPVTSVSSEEEEKVWVQRRKKRAGRSCPGVLRFWLWVFFFTAPESSGTNPSGPRVKFSPRDAFSQQRMSTSDDTDGLRPRYGCKLRLFSAHLELPGGFLSAQRLLGSSGTSARLRSCSCKTPPNFRKKSLSRFVESALSLLGLLFVTACLQLNYDFRVVLVV